MDETKQVKLAVYRHFAETGERPEGGDIARSLQRNEDEILEAYRELAGQRLLVLGEDGKSIRMAPPFSGVPTQHVVKARDLEYFANCAWDALGVAAALQSPAVIHSRCEQSQEPLVLVVSLDGPVPSSWLFHSLVPAAHWWDDIVFT